MLGMLSPEKKSVAQVVLGKLNGEIQSPPSAKEDASAGLEAAMSKFISCVHAKDAKGCVAALSDFIEMHESSESEEPSAPEEEKE